MKRRDFLISLGLFALGGKLVLRGCQAGSAGLERFVEQIQMPFESLPDVEYADIQQWVSGIPASSRFSVVREIVAKKIHDDYRANRVEIVNGLVLSHSELMLYSYKLSHI
jgi:hypothetical protein